IPAGPISGRSTCAPRFPTSTRASAASVDCTEHFPAKWEPVRRRKCDQRQSSPPNNEEPPMTDATPPSPPSFGRPVEPAPRPPVMVPDLVSLSFYKIGLIGGLALATIVPNLLITSLVEERETRQDGVQKEFTRNW